MVKARLSCLIVEMDRYDHKYGKGVILTRGTKRTTFAAYSSIQGCRLAVVWRILYNILVHDRQDERS